MQVCIHVDTCVCECVCVGVYVSVCVYVLCVHICEITSECGNVQEFMFVPVSM